MLITNLPNYQDDIFSPQDLALDPLPGTGVPPVPEDDVHLKVEVDRTRCGSIPPSIDNKLTQLEKNGITVPFPSIIRRCSSHTAGSVMDYWKIGVEKASIRRVWDILAHWEPRIEHHAKSGENRLVVANQKNPEMTSLHSQILAVGVGLIVGELLYDVPFVQWSKTQGNDPHDFQAPAPSNSLYRLEVRGRLNRNSIPKAKLQVHNKFKQADFAAAAGVIFCPRTSLRRSAADIIIMDPVGRGVLMAEANELRAIVRHYIPFFEQQGGWLPCQEFAARLREIADGDDATFLRYLEEGDKALLDNRRPWRTGFRYNGAEFKGTAWLRSFFPAALAGPLGETTEGSVYYGLWTAVIEALKRGKVEKIASMKIREGSTRHGSKVFNLLPDGTAFAYAPDEQLSPGMFDEYFKMS